MKAALVSVIGEPLDSIITSTFALEEDDAAPLDNPVLITFSVNSGQHDPEDAVEALRALADFLDEIINEVDATIADDFTDFDRAFA